jgi:hypothetical protein
MYSSTAEARQVKTAQNSQRSKASNAVLLAQSRAVKSFRDLEACDLVMAATVTEFKAYYGTCRFTVVLTRPLDPAPRQVTPIHTPHLISLIYVKFCNGMLPPTYVQAHRDVLSFKVPTSTLYVHFSSSPCVLHDLPI